MAFAIVGKSSGNKGNNMREEGGLGNAKLKMKRVGEGYAITHSI